MENFVAYNPTKVFFGRNVLAEIGSCLSETGKNVLLLYGKGSVVRHGYYDQVKDALARAGARITEFSGIKPNPVVQDADTAAQLARECKADVVVALGGGSVIDTAKLVAICAVNHVAAWDVMKRRTEPSGALPLIAVLTLAATGTEMNANAVLQNHVTQEKIGYNHPCIYPRYAFLDPSFTLSVPRDQTVNGITDLMAHTLEAYFGAGDAPLSDLFVFSILRNTIKHAPALLENPGDYNLRAIMMWDATCALNGITSWGRKSGDWGVHSLGHNLSLLYDLAHGLTLSISYLAWLRLQLPRIPQRISLLGESVFGVSGAEATVNALEAFFRQIGAPVRLPEAGIGTDKRDEIVAIFRQNKAGGMVHLLSGADYEPIVDYMFAS